MTSPLPPLRRTTACTAPVVSVIKPTPCWPTTESSHPTSRWPAAFASLGRKTTNKLPTGGTLRGALQQLLPLKPHHRPRRPSDHGRREQRRLDVGNGGRVVGKARTVGPVGDLPGVVRRHAPVVGAEAENFGIGQRLGRRIAPANAWLAT